MGKLVYNAVANSRARRQGTFHQSARQNTARLPARARFDPDTAASLAALKQREAVMTAITEFVLVGRPLTSDIAAQIVQAPELAGIGKEVAFRAETMAELDRLPSDLLTSYIGQAALDVIMNGELG